MQSIQPKKIDTSFEKQCNVERLPQCSIRLIKWVGHIKTNDISHLMPLSLWLLLLFLYVQASQRRLTNIQIIPYPMHTTNKKASSFLL